MPHARNLIQQIQEESKSTLHTLKSEAREAQDRLRELKGEFDIIHTRINGFDFNKEIVDILLAAENADLSPFYNLFKKHVGCVFERFKVTETACEAILNRLVELEIPLNTQTSEVLLLHDLSEKVAQLVARNKELEHELNMVELKVELSSELQAKIVQLNIELDEARKQAEAGVTTNRKNQTMSGEGDEIDKEEGELDRSESLNTEEIAHNVKTLLARLGLTMVELVQITQIKRFIMLGLIDHPEPWEVLSDVKRNHYIKLNEWFIQNEHKSQKSFNKREPLKALPTNDALDTAMVIKKLVRMLDRYEISHESFARDRLEISRGEFDRLLKGPQPQWKDLSQSERDLFKRLQRWTRASNGEIDALKRDLERGNCKLKSVVLKKVKYACCS